MRNNTNSYVTDCHHSKHFLNFLLSSLCATHETWKRLFVCSLCANHETWKRLVLFWAHVALSKAILPAPGSGADTSCRSLFSLLCEIVRMFVPPAPVSARLLGHSRGFVPWVFLEGALPLLLRDSTRPEKLRRKTMN